MTVASILQTKDYDLQKITELEKAAKSFLIKKNFSSLMKVSMAEKFSDGARSLIRNYGMGGLSPNTVVLGDSKNGTEDYVQVMYDSIAANKNLLIVRTKPGFDESKRVEGQSIDIWWKGQEGNIGLMLTLAYMLKCSEKWREAQLTLKSVVGTEDERQGVKESMLKFVKDSRIRANVEVLVDNGDPYEQIKKSSKDVDLVFIGLLRPKKSSEYLKYYDDLIKKTSGLPNTIFTLKGEQTEFKEIFQ